MSLVMISTLSCSNLISDSSKKYDGSDSTFPLLKINPVNSSCIPVTGDIEIFFNTSINTNTLELGGDLSPEARTTWKTGFNTNDTLTISPRSQWSEGVDRTLTIVCKDLAGNVIEQLNLQYTIDSTPPTASGSPVSGLTTRTVIESTDTITITFSESMDTGTLNIGGDLSSEANFAWSPTTRANDTLRVSPVTTWKEGFDRTLTIDCKDPAGIGIERLNFLFVIDSNLPTAAGSPVSGSTIHSTDTITITFSEPMNTDTLNIGGDLSSEAIFIWSPTMYAYDTLTLGPAAEWGEGVDRTLTIDCKDLSGDAIARLNFSYGITKDKIKTWPGTQQFGTNSSEVARGVAVDSSSNIYVTGFTDGVFDGCTNAGGHDFFLVKYNSSGQKQWTRQMGSSGTDYNYGVSTDRTGNIYVAGYTSGAFDGYTNAGSDDIFLVKYNSSGENQWTRQMGTYAQEQVYGLSTDRTGNIYVAGQTTGAFDECTNVGERDIFLVKFNSSGEKQWIRQMGTNYMDQARAVSTDRTGNIYVTGYTNGAFDGYTKTSPHDTNDTFLVKYNSSGEKQWTRQMGTNAEDGARGVSTDSTGNIYVAGYTNGAFDGYTNDGLNDIFLVKYNSSGEKQWIRQLGTNIYSDTAYGVSTDSTGNIYITGHTNGQLDGNTNAGSDDIFLVKYNSSGEKQWTRQMSSSGSDYAVAVSAVDAGSIYVSGGTGGAFDGFTNAGLKDMFLAKYDSLGEKQ